MRKIRCIAALTSILIFTLSACGTTAPELSKEELQAKRIATLNVYEDNRVALKVIQDDGQVVWHWTSEKDRILALLLSGRLYNAKDILSITTNRTKDSSVKELAIQFKNGENIKSLAGYGWVYEKNKNDYFGPYWAACDKYKNCKDWALISTRGGELDKILQAIYEYEFSNEETTRDIELEIMSDDRAIPRSDWFSQVLVHDDLERENIAKKIAITKKGREQYWQALQADKARKERMILEEANKMRRAVQIGTQTNCGQVFDIRLPMVGVQTMFGMQYIRLANLYGPSVDCKFINGQYVGR